VSQHSSEIAELLVLVFRFLSGHSINRFRYARPNTHTRTHTYAHNVHLQLTGIAYAATFVARAVTTAVCQFPRTTDVIDLSQYFVYKVRLLSRVGAGGIQ